MPARRRPGHEVGEHVGARAGRGEQPHREVVLGLHEPRGEVGPGEDLVHPADDRRGHAGGRVRQPEHAGRAERVEGGARDDGGVDLGRPRREDLLGELADAEDDRVGLDVRIGFEPRQEQVGGRRHALILPFRRRPGGSVPLRERLRRQ